MSRKVSAKKIGRRGFCPGMSPFESSKLAQLRRQHEEDPELLERMRNEGEFEFCAIEGSVTYHNVYGRPEFKRKRIERRVEIIKNSKLNPARLRAYCEILVINKKIGVKIDSKMFWDSTVFGMVGTDKNYGDLFGSIFDISMATDDRTSMQQEIEGYYRVGEQTSWECVYGK